MTFSIVARSAGPDPETASWGVAVASKFLAVGSAVPAAVAQVGAIATQAHANVAYKGLALAHLDEGATASVALQRLLEEDEGRDHRQVGIVDVEGNAASHPEAPLAQRLLAALEAGDRAGGDSRGRQSAAVLVVREGAGYGGMDDIEVDLRVDDHAAPVEELQRLLGLNDLYLTASTEEEKVPMTDELREELEGIARAAGHRDLEGWVGAENYEMRVAEDLSWVDRRILAIARGEEGAQ